MAEVSFRLSRELEAINRFENVTDRAELIADFVGLFHDGRNEEYAADPCLGADPAVAYNLGQAVAKWLCKEEDSPVGHDGLNGRDPGETGNLKALN
ncbi:RES family NAD+ phosphorylase (plasmid) [Ensifer sp. D2-11]